MKTLNNDKIIDNKLNIDEHMKNILKSQTINLHEIPEGKHSFIAKVKNFEEEEILNYHGYYDYIPYICFEEVNVFICKQWLKVECSGNDVRSKIGAKLQKLDLVEGDIVSFDARVKEELVGFLYVEGKDEIKIDETYCDPCAILPKSYDGTVWVDIYETEFSKYGRVYKNDYTLSFTRNEFNKVVDTIDCKREVTTKRNGFFREAQAMYFEGKHINCFSNVKKLYSSNKECA